MGDDHLTNTLDLTIISGFVGDEQIPDMHSAAIQVIGHGRRD